MRAARCLWEQARRWVLPREVYIKTGRTGPGVRRPLQHSYYWHGRGRLCSRAARRGAAARMRGAG